MVEGESSPAPRSRRRCPEVLDPASRRVLSGTCFAAFGGLRYYGYRWSDPVTGRWVSRDPIGERGGFNLYEPNFNSAANWFDFCGRDPIRTYSWNEFWEMWKRFIRLRIGIFLKSFIRMSLGPQ